jgi:hypothetical protein
MFPQLTEDQQVRVAEEIFAYTSKMPSMLTGGNSTSFEEAKLTA